MSISDRLDKVEAWGECARGLFQLIPTTWDKHRNRKPTLRERLIAHYEGGLVSADLARINGIAVRLSEEDDQ